VLAGILLHAAAGSGARPILETIPPPDIEVACRETEGQTFLFLLNHGDIDRSVDVTSSRTRRGWDHLPGRSPAGAMVLVPAGDVVILVAQPERTPESS
jgi:hypothetical protein